MRAIFVRDGAPGPLERDEDAIPSFLTVEQSYSVETSKNLHPGTAKIALISAHRESSYQQFHMEFRSWDSIWKFHCIVIFLMLIPLFRALVKDYSRVGS